MKGLRYISLNDHSGYGEAARRYLLGLKNAGVSFTWTPMAHRKRRGARCEPLQGGDTGEPSLQPYCGRRIDYDTVVVHMVPEYYPFWKEKERDRRIIGYTAWETNRPPGHWIPILNGLDALLVPCRWNKEVFERSGVSVPIHVVPHISHGESPRRKSKVEAPAAVYTFYTIGAWTARKALWSTLRSYLDAFTSSDSALLVIKTGAVDFTRRKIWGRFHHGTARAVKRIVGDYRFPARVRLVTEDFDREEMLRIHGEGDCYVSLSRSEGWGLGAFDAAGFGKPVIMTGFGGQLDYLPSDLAWLIDYEMVPVDDEMGKASYSSDQNWAEPNLSHASQLMRHAFENREQGRARGAALGDLIRSRFSETAITERLLEALCR